MVCNALLMEKINVAHTDVNDEMTEFLSVSSDYNDRNGNYGIFSL